MVHQYKLNGYNIVLDTCSGSVHVVDEVAYDIIAMYKDKTADEIVKHITETYTNENITRNIPTGSSYNKKASFEFIDKYK